LVCEGVPGGWIGKLRKLNSKKEELGRIAGVWVIYNENLTGNKMRSRATESHCCDLF